VLAAGRLPGQADRAELRVAKVALSAAWLPSSIK